MGITPSPSHDQEQENTLARLVPVALLVILKPVSDGSKLQNLRRLRKCKNPNGDWLLIDSPMSHSGLSVDMTKRTPETWSLDHLCIFTKARRGESPVLSVMDLSQHYH